MAQLQERLFKLQELIEAARAKQHEAQGALKSLHEQLKTEFSVKDMAEAKALLLKTENEIAVLGKQIETRLAKLEAMVNGSKE